MAKCPACGRQVAGEYVRRGTFPCPYCEERLRIPGASGYDVAVGVVASCLLAFLIPYLMGAQGNSLLFWVIALLLPVGVAFGGAVGAVKGFLFPTLEVAPGEDDGTILHLTGPPDSSDKS